MIMERKQRVMFVDDEAGVRESWDRLLTDRGFAVRTAIDGANAMVELEEEAADVVVADLRMPRVDGLQLLEWLKEEQPETRFILVTGYGSDAVEEKARQLGAFGYLHKPVNPETLSAVITSATQVDLSKIQVPAEVVRPAEAVAEATSPEVLATVAVPEVVPAKQQSLIRKLSEVGGGLVFAPLMGLAFVLFLPLIGFGGLFYALGKAIKKNVARA